jgi:branched-chain amino acid transport system substrate-binding protein
VNCSRTIPALIVTLVAAFATPSQSVVPEQRIASVERPDSLFALGLHQFDTGSPVDARWIFEQLARRLPQSSEWQAPSQLMLARTLYRVGDIPATEQAALPLLERVPAGVLARDVEQRRARLVSYARYLLAMVSWRNSDRRNIIEHTYHICTDPNAPARLASDARLLGQATAARADSLEFRGMEPVVQQFVRDAITLNRAIGLYHAGQWTAARSTARALERTSVNSIFSQETASLISEVHRAENSEVRIAVIAPLSGHDSLAGVEMLRGVEFALDQQRSPIISRPIVRSVTSQLDAIKVTQLLTDDPTIRAIIGPLTTSNTIASGAVVDGEETALIAPTATGVGVSDIGPYVFQLNTTPLAQGRLLARIAIDSLKARTVATLSSFEPQDRAMADAFAEEVRALGGEVFIQEWFYPNTIDIRPQIAEIRLASLLSDTSISEDIRRRLALDLPTELDTMRLMREARTIDVLLVSSNNEHDAINIAAQIPTQKIWARILGGSIWGEQAVRQEAGEDVEGVVFATGFDPGAESSRHFIGAYRLDRREDPSNITALTYDATSLVVTAIASGARTRQQVRDYIAETSNWPGAGGMVTFDESGANIESNIRMIRGGLVTPVADWTTLEQPFSWGVSVPPPDLEEMGSDSTVAVSDSIFVTEPPNTELQQQ